jgi:hypothetical protein
MIFSENRYPLFGIMLESRRAEERIEPPPAVRRLRIEPWCVRPSPASARERSTICCQRERTMSEPSNTTAFRRLVPWGVALLGGTALTLATVGLGALLDLLDLIGLRAGPDDAAIGAIIMMLFGVGLLLLIVGLVLALARSRSTARWLIGSGLALLCLGSGPLFALIALAKLGLTRDPNPNPVFEGMLAGFTFIPAVVLLLCGLVVLVGRRFRSA